MPYLKEFLENLLEIFYFLDIKVTLVTFIISK